MIGEHPGDVDQKRGPIKRQDLDRGREPANVLGVPLDVDEAVGLSFGQFRGIETVTAVHRYASTSGDEADDLIGRHRRTAPREPDHDVVEAFDMDTDRLVDPATTSRTAVDGRRQSLRLDDGLGLLFAAQLSTESLGDRLGGDMAFADGGEQQVLVGVVHRLENRRKDRLFEDAASSEPSRRSAWMRSSRPSSIASSRRSRMYHCLILLAARRLATNFSQSRLGPAPRRWR